MPCNCDHLRANEIEQEVSRVACLLDEVKSNKKINKSHWEGYHPDVYNQPLRGLADKLTNELCSLLKGKDVKNYSLELQIWWRDHQKVDAEREAEEIKRKKKENKK